MDARLGADAGLWTGVWASRVLGRRERALLASLTSPESRRLEWLAARTAAKEAVAELLRVHRGIDLLPADIEILPDDLGCPRVHLPVALDVEAIVSLVHTRGRAAALCALVEPGATAGIGIDMEQLRRRPAGFAEAALDAGERALLAAAAPADEDEWLLRCWCAKEAAGKATGHGLGGGLARPVVSELDIAGQRAAVDVPGRRLYVQTHRDDDLIVATTLFEQGVLAS
jgi:phosphopantetheinyl transferase (holo-ACP synthase)